jgi:hypothetical protein
MTDNPQKDKLGRVKRPRRLTVAITYKISPEDKASLLAMAKDHDTNYTAICRAAVRREIAVYEAERNHR